MNLAESDQPSTMVFWRFVVKRGKAKRLKIVLGTLVRARVWGIMRYRVATGILRVLSRDMVTQKVDFTVIHYWAERKRQ